MDKCITTISPGGEIHGGDISGIDIPSLPHLPRCLSGIDLPVWVSASTLTALTPNLCGIHISPIYVHSKSSLDLNQNLTQNLPTDRPSVPSTSFLPAANYWNPVRSASPAMTHHHQTTHHHSSTSQSTFPSYEQPPSLTDTPRASGSSAAPRYATSVASSGSEHLTADEAELRR
jgi:hypothetical protein